MLEVGPTSSNTIDGYIRPCNAVVWVLIEYRHQKRYLYADHFTVESKDLSCQIKTLYPTLYNKATTSFSIKAFTVFVVASRMALVIGQPVVYSTKMNR